MHFKIIFENETLSLSRCSPYSVYLSQSFVSSFNQVQHFVSIQCFQSSCFLDFLFFVFEVLSAGRLWNFLTDYHVQLVLKDLSVFIAKYFIFNLRFMDILHRVYFWVCSSFLKLFIYPLNWLRISLGPEFFYFWYWHSKSSKSY